MSKEKTLKQHLNDLANKEIIKNKKPQDGDKDATGRVYSSNYGGHVPGLYAQGR